MFTGKCSKCGAPVVATAPDGDIKYENDVVQVLQEQNRWLKNQLAIAAFAHEKLINNESVFGEKARALIKSAFEGCTFSPENLHGDIPEKALTPDDPGYYCDQCPHAVHLHNPDGSCPCGINCAVRRENQRVEPRENS